MSKGVKIAFIIVWSLCIAVGCAAYLMFSSPFTITEKHLVYIDSDDDVDSVYAKVKAEGKPSTMLAFKLMSCLKRFSKARTGCYAIEPGENMFTCVRRFANGSQTPIMFHVPEVRTVNDMIERIAPQLMISADDLRKELENSQFIDSLGYSEETLPCLFIPNTYEVYWNTSARNLILRLDKEKNAFWSGNRIKKAESIGFTPSEVVTLASIVESETSYGPEKPIVAGLYIHRLESNMPLQSDPTVIFAIGDFTIHRVTLEHLRYDSPYNTYKYEGLPPGPIRIPSVQGIDAVLDYDHNDYLYMCAKEDFSGSHNFTSSYTEHLRNAQLYQQALNHRGIFK